MQTHEFHNIWLYETCKVAVSTHVVSSDIRWHWVLHEWSAKSKAGKYFPPDTKTNQLKHLIIF